jgi:two-component system cell cycle response regulator DivK
LSAPAGGARDRVRVLLVDDSEDARAMYAQYLTWSGFELLQAGDGAEALVRATADCPDVIVMDLSLPAVDGWAATRAIKADARTAAIPVVALSGYSAGRGGDESLFAAFLTKPCLPDDLVATLRRLGLGGTAGLDGRGGARGLDEPGHNR